MGISESWAAIHSGLEKLGVDARSKLRGPADPAALAKLESGIGHRLPDHLKASLLQHDGSDDNFPILAGLPLMSVNEIWSAWYTWSLIANDTDENAELSQDFLAHPADAVKPLYANQRWVPFAGDSQNFAAVDYDPGPAGKVGQIINAGRDDKVRHVIADSFSDFIAFVAEQFERGRVILSDVTDTPELFIAGTDRDFLQALPYTLGLKPET